MPLALEFIFFFVFFTKHLSKWPIRSMNSHLFFGFSILFWNSIQMGCLFIPVRYPKPERRWCCLRAYRWLLWSTTQVIYVCLVYCVRFFFLFHTWFIEHDRYAIISFYKQTKTHHGPIQKSFLVQIFCVLFVHHLFSIIICCWWINWQFFFSHWSNRYKEASFSSFTHFHLYACISCCCCRCHT